MQYKPKELDSAIFKIRLKNRKPVKINMLEELAIDRNRIGRELMEQPGKYAYFAGLYEEADGELRVLEQELTDSALSHFKMRSVRPTNALIDAMFREDPKWNALNFLKSKLRVMKEALSQRANILSNQAGLIKRDRFFGA